MCVLINVCWMPVFSYVDIWEQLQQMIVTLFWRQCAHPPVHISQEGGALNQSFQYPVVEQNMVFALYNYQNEPFVVQQIKLNISKTIQTFESTIIDTESIIL